MKKALFTLGLFLLCIAASQNALAAPAKASKPVKSKPSSSGGFGLNRLGVEAGLVDPEGASSTLGFGVLADLGHVARDIRLSSHLDYWNKSENDFGAEASIRDISFSTRARYMFHVSSPKWQPYAGAGLGMHFFHSKVVVPGFGFVPDMTVEDSATKVGLDMGGGVLTPVSPSADVFADLWYTVADIDQIAMKAGVTFRLNR
jgi:opacity protein-like surface antigen